MKQEVILVKKKKEKKKKYNVYSYILKKIFYFPPLRNQLLKLLKKKIYQELVLNEKEHPKNVQIKKYQFLISLIEAGCRNFDRNYISKGVIERIFDTLVKYSFTEPGLLKNISGKFEEKYAIEPTSLIVLSPTQRCNLNCTGCYASSRINAASLSYNVIDKIADEVYNEWGNRFMVISGGEPFMYNDNGKTLFDIWEKYNEMFFLVYTNGTMIGKDTAEKLAELGNVTPALSVEGFEKETDERRGRGIFQKVIEAAKNLREAGVPFGVSVTSTSKNFEILMDDRFYDYVFQELGASYMWMFQLMPIGKAKDVRELMITPEQRVNLYRKWEKLLEEKKYSIADFWNSGVLSDGCIAYGRRGGYLYIDWNGNIMPCVFVPFYEDNIIDLYSNGKKLANALFSDLFVNGRNWQKEFGLAHKKNPHNWLMACSIRDNWSDFKKKIISKNSKPEDNAAKEIMVSKEFDEFLKDFDKKLSEKTIPIWKKEYLEED